MRLTSALLLLVGVCLPPLAGCASPPPADAPARPIALVEIAGKVGLDYSWTLPAQRPYTLLDTLGQGAGWVDVDADGWLDVVVVGPVPVLFRSVQGKRFEKVPSAFSLPPANYHGVAAGDYDGDGDMDLYVTAYRGGALLRNEGGLRFSDVGKEVGVAAQPWGSSASFADLDGDGRLDLVIGNYLDMDVHQGPNLFCQHAGVVHSCEPWYFGPERPVVYQNTGAGFVDVTARWGIASSEGKNLGVLVSNLDQQGRPELLLANDMVAGDLFTLQGEGWVNRAAPSGVAFDRRGAVHAGMGVDSGDVDRDGQLDVVVTAFRHQGASLYLALGGLMYQDLAFGRGVGEPTSPYVGFGVKLVDLDNDGWLDLPFAHGHIYETARELDARTSFRQPVVLLQNSGGSYTDVSERLPEIARAGQVGRGLAAGDFDQDGRIDLLVVDSEGRLLLLHNQTEAYPCARLTLVEASGRPAMLARVATTVGGRPFVAEQRGDGSIFSYNEPTVHIGMGEAARTTEITVSWPSGQVERFDGVEAGARATLREGSGKRGSER